MRFRTPIVAAIIVLAAAISHGQQQSSERTGRPLGRDAMYAFAAAYPDRIGAVQYRYGDWAVFVDGTWYHWQDGRLLPENELPDWEAYSSHRFYRYPGGRPTLPDIDEERAEQLRHWYQRNNEDPPVRHMGFLDAIYRIDSRSDAEDMTTPMDFMGFDVRIHRDLVPAMDRVERALRYRSRENPKISLFFDSVGQIDGFNWRYIAGTRARSYHSYGAAIDLIPRRYGKRFPYWRWAVDSGITDWWEIPYTRRWMIPYEVVEAFEQEGFIWGGKWLYFDTMHFEYRPELHLLSDR